MYLTKLQEQRFRRNCELYEDYLNMREKVGDLASRWRLAGILAEKYGINHMTAHNIIVRMEEYYKEEEGRNVGKC